MGASGWSYRVAFDDDAERAFFALQQRELVGDDWLWNDDDSQEGDAAVDGGRRPTSLSELAEAKEDEDLEFWTWGTHSILDMDRLVAADAEDHDGTVRALSAVEVRRLFGSERPTGDAFEAAYLADGSLGVADSTWSGRYTVLYRDGAPDEWVFWGISGD